MSRAASTNVKWNAYRHKNLQTTDNFVRWGGSTLEGYTEAIEGAFEDLASRFVEWDADGIEDIWQAAYRARFYRCGPVLMSALSGLDISLWDMGHQRQELGVPVWQLLGGQFRDRLRVCGCVGGDHPSAVREAAAERKVEGFTAVKMNATAAWTANEGYAMQRKWHGTTRPPDFNCRARERDPFAGHDHKRMARQLAAVLENEGNLLPTFSKFANLARSMSVPVAPGERLHSRHDFRPFFEGRALDIAQPDVSHCGGISELVCIAVGVSRLNIIVSAVQCLGYYQRRRDLYTCLEDPSVFAASPVLGIAINERLVRQLIPRNPLWRG
ncbi:hypothetical protein BS17DRAFT_794712 [Gyrodon lividus]|nr:hypothetical protein BS17DRAFT_794712 [Gyrodon lividus]